ncbi:MAG: Asp-tRNA(Asn)/Glu-tRNA(Gln) amidotransferase subunit GatB [Kiritimatiellae bacterium]|nr:Asp-tRNA(Asn)/Glu-tRNA(Gln) amidotransferase subunit GatB [Kiritimatiellia bacterium]
MSWVAAIGLEVHVQLRTASKMFCGCATSFGAPPNTQVCPVCLGLPGAMPVINLEAIRLTVQAGLLLGCRIAPRSRFDRKNYFYPDMPKNYQISQYDQPLCQGGGLDISTADERRFIRIRRIHLEEDVAKSLHYEQVSGIDFNRAGTPLMEIVTEPDLRTPEEAHAFLSELRRVLDYARISDCNLEEGNVRCDVNVSVRRAGEAAFGTKTELKNLNTFRGVQRALAAEIRRQIAVLESGGRVVQETRRWNDETGMTEAMRTKEEEHDYRYFPEPDLMPVELTAEQIEAWRATLPELPAARRARFVIQYGLPEYDAGVLTADRGVADFFEETVRLCGRPKAVSNWIMTEVLRALGEQGVGIAALPLTPRALSELILAVEQGQISMLAAKDVLSELMERGGMPDEVIRAKGLAQVSDEMAIAAWAQEAIAKHPGPAADYRGGKAAALQFLIGQVMKLSGGKANPKLVAAALRRQLESG